VAFELYPFITALLARTIVY